jgi:hypothetical protein
MRDNKGRIIYIENCHSLDVLFSYLCDLIKNNKQALTFHAPNANWLITGRIRGHIRTICELDDKSDFFRYPISRNSSRDKEKYTMKKVKKQDFEKIFKHSKGKMILATKNKVGEIQEIYVREENTLQDVFEALKQTADFFSTFHFMTRMELCDGW